MNADRVFRAGRHGRVWHWPAGDGLSACGWDLDTILAAPVSVRIEDRCTARGCAVRWTRWLRATIHDCLVDEAIRDWGAA